MRVLKHNPDEGCSECPLLVDLGPDGCGSWPSGCSAQPADAWPGEPDRYHLKVAHYHCAPDWCPLRHGGVKVIADMGEKE